MDEPNDLQNTPETPSDPLPDINIPALRTYKGDINQTVNQDKITTAKILMAEQLAQQKQQGIQYQTAVAKPKNLFALIFGIIFIVGALVLVGMFGYTKILKQIPAATFSNEAFFLFAFDKQTYINSEETKIDMFAKVNLAIQEVQSAKDNTYTDIIFFKTNPDTQVQSRISSAEFFSLYEIQLPGAIGRSISKDFVYGLYKTGVRVEPFIVIGLADYENAFDSMFDWEKTLALDVREFFPNLQKIFNATIAIEIPEVQNATSTIIATSTATSTIMVGTSTDRTVATSSIAEPAQQDTQAINRNVTFTDVVLSNKDTRAVRDENGTPYFYYTFIDRDKILFAQDPKLITEIVRKIKEKQLVR